MTYNDAVKAWGQQYRGGHSPDALAAAEAELRLLFKGGHDLSEEKLKRLSSYLRRSALTGRSALAREKTRAKARAKAREPGARKKKNAKARAKAAVTRAAKRKPAPPAEVIALRLSQSRDWGAFHKQTLEARDGRWKDMWTNFNAKRLKRTKN